MEFYTWGSENDSVSLKKLPMELPAESEVFADSAYTNFLSVELSETSLRITK